MSLSINVKDWKRDAGFIRQHLYVKDKTIYTDKDAYLYFPTRYTNRQLADVSNIVSVLGLVGIEMDNRYCFVNLPAFIETDPVDIETVIIEDMSYYRLQYDADIPIINSTTIVRNETYLFELFDEFFLKARIPWYMDYVDLGRLFTNMKKYTGSNIGNNPSIIEVFSAVIARVPNDLKTQVRHLYNETGDTSKRPRFVQMESVYYAFENTTSRLVGSYSQDGITASLVDPAEKTERIERLLRA